MPLIQCIQVSIFSVRLHAQTLILSIVGSNGASQAILDAEALSNAYDIPAALQAYQDERLTPTAKIVMANRANGPDHVMEVAEQRAPDGFKNVLDVITKEELEDIGRTYKAVAGFEMDKVNKKADDTEGVADKLGLKGPKNMSPSVLY